MFSGDHDHTLDAVADALSTELAASGWVRRHLGERVAPTLTRELTDGLLLALQFHRAAVTPWPDTEGVDLETEHGILAHLGVGYGPALDLAPVVLAHPQPILVYGRRARVFTPMGDGEAAEEVVGRIVAMVQTRSPELIAAYPSVEALLAGMSEPGPQPAPEQPPGDEELDTGPDRDPLPTGRLLLLATLGRHEEVRRLLAAHPPSVEPFIGSSVVDGDRRCGRQLIRWLDAGGPPVPSAEETVASQAGEPGSPRPSWSRARARKRLDRDAQAAARRRARGTTATQLRRILAEEYAVRGAHPGMSTVARQVELIRTPRSRLGQAKDAVEGLGTLAQLATRVAGQLRDDRFPSSPEWLRPPDRAAYRYERAIGEGEERVNVRVDPAAVDYLRRVVDESDHSLRGRIAIVPVWLSSTSDELAVGLGHRRIGVIADPGDAAVFARLFVQAARYDEDLITNGHLIFAEHEPLPYVEIPRP